ncbi:MAG: 2-oxoacid:acceptor oxidoreductase family protein [Bacillota bacterium]
MKRAEVIMAGFGGQGVMAMGMLLAYAGMKEGRHVSWMPSYGPEMRGGTANCAVVVSEEPIASPLVTEPTAVIAMNLPSFDKFERRVVSQGVVVVNASLVHRPAVRNDIRVIWVPANAIALELGSDRVANMVALGAYVAASGVVEMESVVESLKGALPPHRHNLIPLNRQALDRGAACAR